MTTPATGREATAPRPAILPGGWPAHVGPFALLGAAGLYLRDHRAILPARILVHRGLNGHPDRWIPHGVAGVYGPLLLAALVVATLVLASALAERSLRSIPTGDDLGSIERRYRRHRRHRQSVGWFLLAVEYQIALTAIWVSLLPLSQAGPFRLARQPLAGAVLIISFIIVVAVALILAAVGLGSTARSGS